MTPQQIFEIQLVERVKELMLEIKEKYTDKLEEQGHRNTGRLIETAQTLVEINNTIIEGKLNLLEYYQNLERRLNPGDVPFTRGSGRGSNKMIDALIDYFKSKGNSEKESKSAAFATANVWKKEGRPSNSSKRFSRTGNRLRPLGQVIDELNETLADGFAARLDKALTITFNESLSDIPRVFEAEI